MSQSAVTPYVRISSIAGHYLVFNPDHVAHIRRNGNICSVLVGTTPQNATQNVFLSLPLELLPEEARLLVDQKVAHLVDETSYHLSSLKSSDPAAREAYIASLRDRRQKAQKLLMEEHTRKLTEKTRRARPQKPKSSPDKLTESSIDDAPQKPEPAPQPQHDGSATSVTVTPTTSEGLLPSADDSFPVARPPISPLYTHLHSLGYFMTPGLRFGADYSVYPGDPLRYHAHFLATSCGWDEPIPMLDLVGGGRLGTSVKKGFLIGGEVSDASEASNGSDVRAFTIEWAAM